MRENRTQKAAERKRQLFNRKRRIQRRLRERVWPDRERPMFTASNIHYDLTEKDRGLSEGGIGAMHLLARQVGLIKQIDAELHLLKRHLPYHESDHVLNMAYNILSGGTCLEDLELRRNNEAYLDALGAQRIPDPTTEGDFCRRFEAADVESLMDAINETRIPIWQQQPKEFFDEAVIDFDGSLAATNGECKEGMALSYKGVWGHPNIKLRSEETAEFPYRPTACKKTYRVIVLRKNLSVEKGEQVLFDDLKYFFYITNDEVSDCDTLVARANGRCQQENLIEQLKNGVHALRMPVGDLVSNGAYMVMASLAWTLKAWFALLLPEKGRWKDKHRREKQSVLSMKFKGFVNAFVRVPAQVVRTGRRLAFKLLAWNSWQELFLRGVDALRSTTLRPSTRGSNGSRPLRC